MESLKKAANPSEDFGLRKRFPWSFRYFGDLESRVITENIRSEEENFLSNLLGNQISDIRNSFVGRIENLYLWSRYVLCYEEMRANLASFNVAERVVIHSTSFSAAIEIAGKASQGKRKLFPSFYSQISYILFLLLSENNFDWRLVKRHRFGHGVSFARDVDYAAKQATQKGTYIVAGILVANSKVGKDDTLIPPGYFDTTTNAAKSVYVKYNDNDYYPYYIVD